MANHFRNILPFVVPRWLSQGDGEKVLYTLGMLKDAATERLRQGLEARFPTRANSSALKLLGEERGIPRGRTETNEHYARRLIGWRYPRGHRVRGSAFALLEQVSEYWGGLPCWTIDVSGNRHDRDAAGNESYSYGNSWNWDGEPATPNWARFWVVIDASDGTMGEHPDFGDPTLYGGELYDDAYSVGQTGATSFDVLALRQLFTTDRPWKPAGTRAEWIIVSLDGVDYTPDGTWADWAKVDGDHLVPSRPDGWRFWAVDESRNVYTANSSTYHERTYLPDETLYTPSAASYSATITMPDLQVYTADGSEYVATIQMVDDGGIPV